VEFFKIGLFNSVVPVTSFVIGLRWGVVGVAIAYTISNYAVILPASWWRSGCRGPVSSGDLVETAIPHAAATLAAGIALIAASVIVPTPGIGACGALLSLSYMTYAGIMLIFPVKRQVLLSNLKAMAIMLVASFERF
jgi:polysaccharide transporter, PST family